MLKHLLLACFGDNRVRLSTPILNRLTGMVVYTPKLNCCFGVTQYSIEAQNSIEYTGLVIELRGKYYALSDVLMCYLHSHELHNFLSRSTQHQFGLPCYLMFVEDLNQGLLNENIKTAVFRSILNNTSVRDQLKQEFNLSCVK